MAFPALAFHMSTGMAHLSKSHESDFLPEKKEVVISDL